MFYSKKEYLLLYEFIYTMIFEGIPLWKESHPVCLAFYIQFYFQSILHFYSALFYNVYYLQCLFLENDIITDAVERKNIFYSFQLKSFEHNNVLLFQKKQKNKKSNSIKIDGDGYSGPKCNSPIVLI